MRKVAWCRELRINEDVASSSVASVRLFLGIWPIAGNRKCHPHHRVMVRIQWRIQPLALHLARHMVYVPFLLLRTQETRWPHSNLSRFLPQGPKTHSDRKVVSRLSSTPRVCRAVVERERHFGAPPSEHHINIPLSQPTLTLPRPHQTHGKAAPTEKRRKETSAPSAGL